MEYCFKYFFFGYSEVSIIVIRMWAGVDDTVHVEVQVVELGDLVLLDDLAEARVALAQPPVELGDPHPAGSGSFSSFVFKFSTIQNPFLNF